MSEEPAVTRSLLRTSFAASVGTAIAQLATPAVFALLARKLPAIEFGALRQIVVVQSLVLIVCTLGMPTAMLYGLGRAADENERRNIYGSAFLWMVISSLIAAVMTALAMLAASRALPASALAENTLVAAVGAGLGVHALFIPPLLMSRQASGRYVVFTATQTILVCALSWFLVGRDTRAHSALVAAAITAAVGWVATSIIFARLAGSARTGWRVGLKENLRYATPVGVSSALYAISYQLDHAVASRLFLPATYALYAAGAWQLPIGPLVQRAQADVLLPILSAHYTAGRAREFWQEWKRLVGPFGMIGAVLFWGIFPVAGDIVHAAFGERFAASGTVLRIYTLILPLRMAALTLPMRAAGSTALDVVACFGFAAVNVAIGWLLTPSLGLIGPAVGLLAGYITWMTINVIGTARVLRVGLQVIVPVREIAFSLAGAGLAALPAWLLAVACHPAEGATRLVYYWIFYAFALAVVFLGARRRWIELAARVS